MQSILFLALVWPGLNNINYSPFISGVIAAYLSRDEYKKMSPAELKKTILSLATKDALKLNLPNDRGATANLLAFISPP